MLASIVAITHLACRAPKQKSNEHMFPAFKSQQMASTPESPSQSMLSEELLEAFAPSVTEC